MDAEEALEDEDEEEGSKAEATKQHQQHQQLQQQTCSSRPAAAAAGNGEVEVEGRCAQTTLYIEVFNHTLPLTQRFRRRRHVGYWWKRTQELTRSLRAAYAPELTKIT